LTLKNEGESEMYNSEFSPMPGNSPRGNRKTIFEDPGLIVTKGHAYLAMYQQWQLDRCAGRVAEPLFPAHVAKKLGISDEDAEELIEFCHINGGRDFGEFARDYLFGQF
jgi:hypothetical protein